MTIPHPTVVASSPPLFHVAVQVTTLMLEIVAARARELGIWRGSVEAADFDDPPPLTIHQSHEWPGLWAVACARDGSIEHEVELQPKTTLLILEALALGELTARCPVCDGEPWAPPSTRLRNEAQRKVWAALQRGGVAGGWMCFVDAEDSRLQRAAADVYFRNPKVIERARIKAFGRGFSYRIRRACPGCSVDGETTTGKVQRSWAWAILEIMEDGASAGQMQDELAVKADELQARGEPLGEDLARWLRGELSDLREWGLIQRGVMAVAASHQAKQASVGASAE